MNDEAPAKRWTAKRKTAVVMDVLNGKTTVAEVGRASDLTVSGVKGWLDQVEKSE
ncbi:DUF1153 domain-containing protein [Thioalkalivibrio sp. ALM2T]|uniref:DUF1153 domain-containing protein n=1 Tax=Thioalkalivibrio sp. ALM2T TaxID=1158184 RepID=UPI0018CBEFCF